MLGKVPRFLQSQARSQKMTLLPVAKVARDKEGFLGGGDTRANGGYLPLPTFLLAWNPCRKKPLANASASVLQAHPLPLPRPLTSHY